MADKSNTHAICVPRWQLTPQTKRTPNPQGPRTGRGNAAVHERGTVKSPLHASAMREIALVREIAPNLQTGKTLKTQTPLEHFLNVY